MTRTGFQDSGCSRVFLAGKLKFNHPQLRVSATHVPDELQFSPPCADWDGCEAAGTGRPGIPHPVPAGFPEVDVRPGLLYFPARGLTPYFSAYFIRGIAGTSSLVLYWP